MNELQLVLIKTESGKWSREVSLGDSLFSDILAPFVDLEVPIATVVLPEVISRWIEEEWDSLQKLLEIIQEDKKNKNVPLSEIARIVRVLNPPEDWWMYVSTTREDPGYIDHLTLIALSDPSYNRSYTIESSMYADKMIKEMGEEGRGAFTAVIRNAIALNGFSSTIFSVDWEAILEILNRMEIAPPLIVSNTILTLSGKGNINSPTVEYVHMSLGDELRQAYEVLMRSIPEDTDFQLLGLNLEMGVTTRKPGTTPFVNRILNAIPWLNYYIITTIANRERLATDQGLHSTFVFSDRTSSSNLSEWTEEHVRALDRLLGSRRSLIKTLLIILNNLGRSDNPEWERLAELIEDRIEG